MGEDPADPSNGSAMSSGPIRSAKQTADVNNLESIRPYRSRKDRPCDRCRKRKQRCIVFDKTQKCLHCNLSSAECTYDAKEPSKSSQASSSGQTRKTAAPVQPIIPSLPAVPPNHPVIDQISASKSNGTQAVPSTITYQQASSVSPASYEDFAALDVQTDPNVELYYIGTASERDAMSLARLASNTYGIDASGSERVPGLKIREVSRDVSKPATFVYYRSSPYATGMSAQLSSLNEITALLGNDGVQASLAAFFANDGQALPIWTSEHTATLGPSSTDLQTACIAGGLAYTPLRQLSYQAWAISQKHERLHGNRARLSTIQAALTILNGRNAIDPAGNFIILGATVAVAQLLGLHRDCSDWLIPEWEKQLRTRLWWALLQYDRITGFLFGRKPLLAASVHDVAWPDTSGLHNNTPPYMAFVAQCELTQIIDSMSHFGLSSFAIVSQANLREHLEELVTLRARLGAWYQDWLSLFDKFYAPTPPGVESLRLLYLHCSAFLAATTWSLTLQHPHSAHTIDQARISCLQASAKLVEFVEGLTNADLASYWPAHSPFILSTCLTTLVRMSLQSASPADASGCQDAIRLLKRLITVLRTNAEDKQWDIASLALQRAKYFIPILARQTTELSAALEPLQHALPQPPNNDDLEAFFNSILQDKAFESLFDDASMTST